MAKRLRDGECCAGCGMAGLTLDRTGLCYGCGARTVGSLRALDDGYEVPLPMVAAERAVPVGPLCELAWGLTAPVFVAKRPVERGLFDFLKLDGYTVGRS